MKLKQILLESSNEKDKTVWEGEYISVKKKGGWYEYLHDGTGKMILVLGYRLTDDRIEFLGRFEETPPHGDGIQLCGLTGGVEKSEKPLGAAKRELKEEAGIDKKKENFLELGTVRNSKASDSFGYLFGIDLSDVEEKEKYVGKGDGTQGEKGAYCKWVLREDILEGKDPLAIVALARLENEILS